MDDNLVLSIIDESYWYGNIRVLTGSKIQAYRASRSREKEKGDKGRLYTFLASDSINRSRKRNVYAMVFFAYSCTNISLIEFIGSLWFDLFCTLVSHYKAKNSHKSERVIFQLSNRTLFIKVLIYVYTERMVLLNYLKISLGIDNFVWTIIKVIM